MRIGFWFDADAAAGYVARAMMDLMRRHMKAILAVVTVIVVLSFVIWGVPGLGGRGFGGGGDISSLVGIRASRAEIATAQKSIYFNHFLSGQEPRLRPEELANEITLRLLLLRKARELNLRVSDEEVGRAQADLFRVPLRPNEDPSEYMQRLRTRQAEILRQLSPMGIAARDLDAIMREGMMIGALQRWVSHTVQVTPQEVRLWWNLANETVTARIVRFKMEEALPQVEFTEEEAKAFYESNPAPFALPERTKVRFVRFDLEPAKQQATVTEEELRLLYERNKNFFRDEVGQTKPFEEVRADLEERLRTQKAQQKLWNEAMKLVQEVFPSGDRVQPVAFVEAVAARGLVLQESDFFALNEPVVGVHASADFNRMAFKLREDFRYGDPVLGHDGVYVMEFVARQPRDENPDFARVREKVRERFRRVRAYELTQRHGRETLGKILEAMAQGKDFSAACASQGLPALGLPPFRAAERLTDVPDEAAVKYTALQLAAGQTSEFVPTAEGGFILHLETRAPPDDGQFEKERENARARLLSQKRQRAFEEWLDRLQRESGFGAHVPEGLSND